MRWQDIEIAAASLQEASGGHTTARRGTVTLPNKQKVFVKLATNLQTQQWLAQELTAYHWLEAHNYVYAPRLLAEGPNGFALPDLSDWDWSDDWTSQKLEAAFRAMDALGDLSTQAASEIDSANFGDNPWLKAPRLAEAYLATGVAEAWFDRLDKLLGDEETLKKYELLAAREPWRGSQLVHYDVRADNFGYNPATGQGVLVDWNWLSLGSSKLDQTGLLVNVYKAGYANEVKDHKDRLDAASLGWFIGFCLKAAASPADSPRLINLRLHQLESALCAHELAQKLRSGF